MWVYAILRAVPNKLGGVVALFSAVLIFGVLSFVDNGKDMVGCTWCVVKQIMFWSLVRIFLLLRWLGRCPAEEPFNSAARVISVAYFSFFFIFPVWSSWGRLKKYWWWAYENGKMRAVWASRSWNFANARFGVIA